MSVFQENRWSGRWKSPVATQGNCRWTIYRPRSPDLDREEPSVDGQTSQPIEDRYSSRVDEPEPVEEAEEEWFDDDADED